MSKRAGASKGRSQFARVTDRLLLIGAVLYLVAWFVPAHANLFNQDPDFGAAWTQAFGVGPLTSVDTAASGPDWLPGWAACSVAFHMLVDGAPDEPQGTAAHRRIAGSSCLTNAPMLLALVLALVRRAPRLLGALLIACTALNASWIWLVDANPFAFYRTGYFLWLVSFPLFGVGVLLRPRAK